jgi:hypothetical protein
VSAKPPPVYLEGEGAILPDGRFIPEANLRAGIQAVVRLCEWFESLPPEVRLAVEIETHFAGLEDE